MDVTKNHTIHFKSYTFDLNTLYVKLITAKSSDEIFEAAWTRAR